MKIIGRVFEQQKLAEIVASDKAEFVAIYGRRRVGKTFLIKEYFDQNFAFYATGLANSNTQTQLTNFTFFLNQYFQKEFSTPQSWLEAFAVLRTELSKKTGTKIVFLDELPWFDTKKSDFLTGLEFFWNSWASTQPDLKLLVCGSAASWMIHELIRNKGGLYNRVTQRMKIEPFTLNETESYFQAKDIGLDRYQIVQLYMVMGGVPYYLEQVKRGQSAAQNVEQICFEETGLLKNEFKFIFSSLFNQSGKHEQLLRKIYELGTRATRNNLINYFKLISGGDLTIKLNELEESGFLKSYTPFGINKAKKVYVIADFYTLFYFKFIESSSSFEAGSWVNRVDDATVRVWPGLAFEQICWNHIGLIKKAMGIQGIYSETSVWHRKGNDETKGAEIDLVIDRKDHVISLFEIKFSNAPYSITKNYDLVLRNKMGAFREETKTRKALFMNMITPFGLVQNEYARSIVQHEFTLNDLFTG